MTRDATGQPADDVSPDKPEKPGQLPLPGEIFDGKYRIERSIGQGAMAVVLEATHLHLQDRVAIKLLLPQWTENADLVERFMREGRAATRIRSEHVVRVFDVGVSDGHPYLVMEYLDGSDLDQLLERDGRVPLATAIDYLLQACEAIAEAHVRGIVHRDLKPANLFLTRRADGSACVKVLDFGISKATDHLSPDTRTTAPSASWVRRTTCRPSRCSLRKTSMCVRMCGRSGRSCTSSSSGLPRSRGRRSPRCPLRS